MRVVVLAAVALTAVVMSTMVPPEGVLVEWVNAGGVVGLLALFTAAWLRGWIISPAHHTKVVGYLRQAAEEAEKRYDEAQKRYDAEQDRMRRREQDLIADRDRWAQYALRAVSMGEVIARDRS